MLMFLFLSRMSSPIIIITLHTLLLLTSSHCHNDIRANESTTERSCVNSFAALEDDLLSRELNRYNLLRTFYPPRGALPVFVIVTYQFGELENQSIWYWSESEIYLIQPLEVFQFTSLFYSNYYYRQANVDLDLSEECVETRDEYMEMLTQRVRRFSAEGG